MKTRACISLFLFLVFLIELVASIFWNRQGIDYFKGGDLLNCCLSPDEKHEARAYLLNGGATTAFAVYVKICDMETEESHNVYYCYRCEEAEMQWIDNRTIEINSIQLDIENDIYDSREIKETDLSYPAVTIKNQKIRWSPDKRYKALVIIEQWEDQRSIGLVTVEDQRSKTIRLVYRCEPYGEIELEWLDEKTVLVNGIELDVETDYYDSANPEP